VRDPLREFLDILGHRVQDVARTSKNVEACEMGVIADEALGEEFDG
jgi:hypothetical protein